MYVVGINLDLRSSGYRPGVGDGGAGVLDVRFPATRRVLTSEDGALGSRLEAGSPPTLRQDAAGMSCFRITPVPLGRLLRPVSILCCCCFYD